MTARRIPNRPSAKRPARSKTGASRARRSVPKNTALDRLSRRLWTSPRRPSAPDREPPTVGGLIQGNEADAFVRLLRTYAENLKAVPRRTLAREVKNAPPQLAGESAAFLITGTLALGAAGLGEETWPLFDPLLRARSGSMM
jgi:hypothetical protein